MSLLEQLKAKRGKLKACTTIETDADGNRYEIANGERRLMLERVVPFVVDNKPDMRVACIQPGLFLSSQDPANDIESLRQNDIRHVCSIGLTVSNKCKDVNYRHFELLDLPEANIEAVLRDCLQFIHENSSENVLVHCNAGVSRSATIVIAYLMATRGCSYDEAFAIVKDKRNCARPNEGFVEQLRSLENTINAWF